MCYKYLIQPTTESTYPQQYPVVDHQRCVCLVKLNKCIQEFFCMLFTYNQWTKNPKKKPKKKPQTYLTTFHVSEPFFLGFNDNLFV